MADMEAVLDIYQGPYDPVYPVICMDEQPKQLIRDSRPSLPIRPGSVEKVDHEYIREGMCCVWMFTEPLGQWRDVRVTTRKTRVDWAEQMRQLTDDPRYAQAKRITVVCDNLITHSRASLHTAFEPAEAHRIASKIDLVHSPEHGSWLNIAECELNVLTRQCLTGRIPKQATIAAEASASSTRRHAEQTGVTWQFTTADARVKLKSLYPKVVS